MTEVYRDMHKINEAAATLYIQLERYMNTMIATVEYEDRDDLHTWVDDDHFQDDPGAAIADAEEKRERYLRENPEEMEHQLDPEIRRVTALLKAVKDMTTDDDIAIVKRIANEPEL